jgi:hypothetical protein
MLELSCRQITVGDCPQGGVEVQIILPRHAPAGAC